MKAGFMTFDKNGKKTSVTTVEIKPRNGFMVTLNELQLSDVFFNFPHDNYINAIEFDFDDEEQEKEAIESALFEDAKVFSDLIDGQVTPQYLVADFLSRI